MNSIQLQELECFRAVAEELNFSRAARRLHLSQPPLSRHVQALEHKLGVQLLQRSTRAVRLTSAGALYLKDVREILTRLDSATVAVRRAAQGEHSRLTIAFVGALLDQELVRLLRGFRRAYPHCQIHLKDLSPNEQLEALRAGELDGAFVGATPQKLARSLTVITWRREPLMLALPARHALSGKKAIALESLREEPWVIVAREAAAAFRRQFDLLCLKAGFKPRVIQESARAAAVLTMVAAGQGISLLPKSLVNLLPQGVIFRPMRGTPLLEHAFVYPKKNSAITQFVELVRQDRRGRVTRG